MRLATLLLLSLAMSGCATPKGVEDSAAAGQSGTQFRVHSRVPANDGYSLYYHGAAR